MKDAYESLTDRIRSLEEALLSTHVRQSAEKIESLLCGDFFEFSSSGRVYRYTPGDTFTPVSTYRITEFSVLELSPECVLATYSIALVQGDQTRHSLRSTIWQRRDSVWKAVFHQGTAIESNPSDILGQTGSE